ncbi:ParB/RepB/Spo0J family partition protein [Lentzea sp. NPDC058450]|uniref:ParB/RepB/Spo0J family partition protein n=1 Tax=Lentzea sp. NPDC058450 TaxID=3346505 RepID=UPI0036474D0F
MRDAHWLIVSMLDLSIASNTSKRGLSVSLNLVETSKSIELGKITESGQKVRETTVESGVEGLLQSILLNGQIHAVSLIENADGTYELINGHRRFAAARMGGLSSLRANVYEVPAGEEDSRELFIQQHLHAANLTESLTELERAEQFSRVMSEFNLEVEALPEIFKGESVESIRDCLKLLNIDERVRDLVTANPDRFSPAHLQVLADYATPSTKGAWRMKPDEQVAAAEMLVRQEDKRAVADPRKFDAHIKSVVKARRDHEKEKKDALKSKRPQADPVKSLFRGIDAADIAIKSLINSDMSMIKEIEAVDKGQALKSIYDLVEALSSFADGQVSKLPVRRVVS